MENIAIIKRIDLIKRIYLHLWKQGKAAGIRDDSYDGGYSCKYRAHFADGTVLMCAAGCLIDDEFYDSSFEGLTINGAVVRQALVASFGRELTLEETQIIAVAQTFHDQTMVHCRDIEDVRNAIVEYLHTTYGYAAYEVVSYIKKETVGD